MYRFGVSVQNLIISLPGITEPVFVMVPNSPGYRSIGVRLDEQTLTVLLDCEILHRVTIEDELAALSTTGQTFTVFDRPVTVGLSNSLCIQIHYE